MVTERTSIRMSEKNMMRDCLDTLKFLADSYNRACIECDSQDLRGVLRNILNDKLELEAATFQFLNQRGWYRTAPAQRDDVQALKENYQTAYQEVMSFYQ